MTDEQKDEGSTAPIIRVSIAKTEERMRGLEKKRVAQARAA